MNDPKGYYARLGVSPNASQDEIKAAWKELMRKNHPDVNPNPDSTKISQEINEAYDALSSEEKRASYASVYNNTDPSYGDDPFSRFFNIPDFENIHFRSEPGYTFFGNQRINLQNSNLNFPLEIDIEDLFDLNKKYNITYSYQTICNKCNNLGYSKFETCPACQGQGHVIQSFGSNGMRGGYIQQCGFCSGQGKKGIDICDSCIGTGFLNNQNSIEISEINLFEELVFKEKGHIDRNPDMPPGDLVIKIVPRLSLSGIHQASLSQNNLDITLFINVDVLNIACENTIIVTGLNKENHEVRLDVSKNTYSFPNKGIQVNKDHRSDLIFHVSPQVKRIEKEELRESITKYLNEVNT